MDVDREILRDVSGYVQRGVSELNVPVSTAGIERRGFMERERRMTFQRLVI